MAGTFALAIAQRRRETAVLRALGATPRQVRRLIAAEALIVSARGRRDSGALAGRPLALAIVDFLADHGAAPDGFEPGHSWIPLVAAVGGGIGIAQLAVVAAARRAGRVRPAEALREVAIEHGRPGLLQLLSGVLCLAGGGAMAIIFSGEAALVVRDPRRHPARDGDRAARALAPRPAGRASSRCRSGSSARPGCSRARASRPTAGAPRRSPRRSC